MFRKYLVTGAAGFLGRAVIAALDAAGNPEIHALVMQGDPLVNELPDHVHVSFGDICESDALEQFFSAADQQTCVIHCAGLVSVASHPGERIYRVNAGGTANVLRYCTNYNVGKLIYVSSVHAIPKNAMQTEITKETLFSPDLVSGDYAKSKAIATTMVFDAANDGLNVNVVFPSGIIGPNDIANGSISTMLQSFIAGKLPLAVKGGYDFVDVRDVAAGIIACAKRGLPGHGYILSGRYASIRDILNIVSETLHLKRTVFYLPIRIAKWIAPLYEKWCLMKQRPLFFTPEAVAVLASKDHFSREAAEQELDFSPRALETSIRDMVVWLQRRSG